MSEYQKGVDMHSLIGEKIIKVSFGNPLMPKCGSYGAYTLTTESGK